MGKSKASIYRLLDANLNRSREGLRVVEDAARFLWNKASLYKSIRKLRHELHRISARQFPVLIASRDSESDTGRVLLESGRASVKDVITANMRRAQEAVRVLEEYGKVFSAEAGAEFKKIRYQLYIVEKKLWTKK